MKTRFPLLLSVGLLFSVFASAQSSQGVLDGRTFAIELFTGDKLDSKETLVFDKGLMDPLDCHQYGFTASVCQAKKSGDLFTFRVVCKSEKEGTMAWQGKVTGANIEGTVVWSKASQSDINYTFSGKEIKK